MSEHGCCPACGYWDEKVIMSRLTRGRVYRRLQCRQCGARRSVYEVTAEEFTVLLVALKKRKNAERE